MEWEKTAALAATVTEREHTGSTNADLVGAVAARGDIPHLSVLLTRDQRTGRGRLDRMWTAPPGAALAVSVLVRVPGVPATSRGWIPLIAGAAMARAVAAQLPGHTVGVKWPNDVMADGRKICGVLVQGTTDPDAAVIGTGINTAMTVEQLPVPTAVSFAALGATADGDALLADYLSALSGSLDALAADDGDAGASGIARTVSEACITLGRDVTVSLPGGEVLRGTAESLAGDGRLVIRSADGVAHTVSAGDVVHLRPALG